MAARGPLPVLTVLGRALPSPPARRVNLSYRPAHSCCAKVSRRLDAVQAVRRVLAGEEDNVAVRRRLARVHHVGWNVDHRSRLSFDGLLADLGSKRALQDVDPLLVGMRMRLSAGAGRHAHQRHDHALSLDAGTVGGRLLGPTEDVVDLGEVEHVFAVARAFRAGRPRRLLLRHACLLRSLGLSASSPHLKRMRGCEPSRQANARAGAVSSSTRARPPRMADWPAAGTDRLRTCDTPSGMPMSKG